MRLGGTVAALLAATVLTSCGTARQAAEADPKADRACRVDFESLRQTQGENGNTAPVGTALHDRWDAEDRAVSKLSHRATAGDCPGLLRRYERRFDALVDLGYTARDVDMAILLVSAEGDLRHAVATRDYDPLPPRLARLFRVLRTHAPPAHDDVQDAVAEAGEVDLDDKGAVADAVAAMEQAADDSADTRICRKALAGISQFELDEE
jgi:hypothetical protein